MYVNIPYMDGMGMVMLFFLGGEGYMTTFIHFMPLKGGPRQQL